MSAPAEPRRRATLLACLAACLLATGCSLAPRQAGTTLPVQGLDLQPDLRVSSAPFDHLEANWKHRLAQPYVFLEARGSYTAIGGLLAEVVNLAGAQRLEISGPPFALYYDDPGLVNVDELRMRACLPLDGNARVEQPLGQDVLPSTTVVYAFVAGPYPDVPRAYPAMFRYMQELGWRENGPIRESYLVNPAEVGDFSELVTEVQIPSMSAR